MTKKILGAALGAALLAATGMGANAQSTFNIGPGNVGPGGPGGGGGGCLSTVIAGNTSMYICPTYYTAQQGGTQCQGGVNFVGGGYNLGQGPCNNGHYFLGGRLACAAPAGGGGGGGGIAVFNIGPGGGGGGGGGSNTCHWQPSAQGAAQGYVPENVYVRY